jgi:hypothetical protein
MAIRMQQRRGSAAEWSSVNPVLGSGEIGFETDNGQFKIGNGTDDWESLPYFTNAEDIQELIDNLVDGAPELLNTLKELSAAIGDDPDFINTLNSRGLEDLSDVVYTVPPEPGQVLRFENGMWEPKYTKVPVIVDNAAPELAEEGRPLVPGDLWWNSWNGKLYVYYEDYDFSGFWVEAKGPSAVYSPEIEDLNFPAEPNDQDQYAGFVYNAGTNSWNSLKDKIEALYDVQITNPELGNVLMFDGSDWQNYPGIFLDENNQIPATFMDLIRPIAVSDAVDAIVNDAGEGFETLAEVEQYIAGVEEYLNNNFAIADNVPALTVKTSSEWDEDTSVPISGSINVELGSGVSFKVGNGADTFADLEYVPTIDSVNAQISQGITEKANIDGQEFTGNVVLPSTTTIGDVSGTEIGYLDGVTSAIQTQLNTLDSDKADLASPTFTGTVSGITSSMVGLGSVDNTSDADKPVSTAQQTALDAKLNLSGGTMTGKVTLDSDPTQALHAVTKQYVDNVEAGLITRPQVRAATTANLNNVTYANGTAGTGATLTSDSNGAFPLIDGVQLTTVNGNRGLLVKNQTNAAHNGRYNLTTQGDENTPWVLTRCGLCDNANEIPGSYIFVTDGTVNAQTGWVQHVDDPATFVVGTDDIDVYQFAGAGTVTAGTNISVSGNQVSVVNSPTFSGSVNASAAGVVFSDGTQTKVGVSSISTFTQQTTNYTLNDLSLRDNIVEMNSATPVTFTIPTNAALAWPVGASMDIFQTGAGEVTIAPASGVTLNGTPGFKLRTQWSSATILKRGADSWVVYGDLKS